VSSGSDTPYDEREVARRWWMLPLHSLLPVSSGKIYQLRYVGRPGGPAGPDVHDALLYVPATGEQLVGDVEFHTAASEWKQHHHHDDPRYNQVILHVVLVCDDPQPTLRQDGTLVPVCSLNDMLSADIVPLQQAHWPCQVILPCMTEGERHALLRRAGLLRFEQKTHSLVEHLHTCSIDEDKISCYDRCLFIALAEALGYGRDRAFFRAAGYALLGQAVVLPEPLGRVPEPPPLDAQRLAVLRSLLACIPGLWSSLLPCLWAETPHSALSALRAFFVNRGLSLARTDILMCNVVLPFAAALALLEHDALLAEQAECLYLQHPGLPSNAITRAMCRQLQLAKEPAGSCQQQGLHYIYQQTCREKRCAVCIAGRSVL
jgi:hypothetical protein